MKKNRNKWIPFFMAGVLAAGCLICPVTADAAKKKVNLNGTYHAALGISTADELGISRNAYYAKKPNKYYKTKQWKMLVSEGSGTGASVEHKGKFTDVVIKGNGKYTVKLEKADFEGETTISMLHVATDIPVNDKITFSNVSAKINGKTVVTFEEPYMEEEKQYLSGGMDIILMNYGREELVQQLSGRGVKENGTDGYDLLTGTGNDAVEITFTVNGFSYDKKGKKPKEAVSTPEVSDILPTAEVYSPEPELEERVSDAPERTPSNTPTASPSIIAVVVAAVAFCGVVIVIVNGRRKRK